MTTNITRNLRYLFLALAFATLGFTALSQMGCTAPVSSRQLEVKTLQTVGLSAKASVNAAAQLLKQGQITVAQWQQVAGIYDNKFQPAFALAVTAAHSDLSSIASPDLMALAGQIAGLVAQMTTNPR